MVTRWGMSESVGLLVQAGHQDDDFGFLGARDTSEYLAKQVDAAMQAIVKERLAHTRTLLKDNVALLHKLAALLLEHESLDANEIRQALGLAAEPVDAPPARVESIEAEALAALACQKAG
jgi:cell division protease FtsH